MNDMHGDPQSSLPKIPCAAVVLLTVGCGYHGNVEALFLYGISWVYVMSHKAISHSKFRDFDSKSFFNEKCQTMQVLCCVFAVMPQPIVTMVTRCFS